MRRPSHAAPVATAVCASLFVLTVLAVRMSSPFRARDAIAFDGFLRFGDLEPLGFWASLADPVAYLLIGGLCAAVAFLDRTERRGRAAANAVPARITR